MVLYDISMAKMRFFVVENRLFKKWSELGKMGKNGEKSLTQNSHYISTYVHSKTDDPLRVTQYEKILIVSTKTGKKSLKINDGKPAWNDV